MADKEEKVVTITQREYDSLNAAAELMRYPDVLQRTIAGLSKQNEISLEDAFLSILPEE